MVKCKDIKKYFTFMGNPKKEDIGEIVIEIIDTRELVLREFIISVS